MALPDFYTGFMTTAMAADELVTSIVVPLEPGEATFHKLGRKQANTPAVVTVAVHLAMDGDTVTSARIALGAVDEHPIRAAGAEAAITGAALAPAAIADAAAAAAEECHPFTDALASDWYRRRMVGVLVGRALTELAGAAAERGA